jgi:hypothetical protein
VLLLEELLKPKVLLERLYVRHLQHVELKLVAHRLLPGLPNAQFTVPEHYSGNSLFLFK